MTKHSRVIEIRSDNANAVESFIHSIKTNANDGQRYGVDIEVRRVNVEDKEIQGFDP